MLFCHITARIESKADDRLLGEKGFNSFPTLAILNAEGDVVSKKVDRSSLDTMGKSVGTAQAHLALAKRVADGEKGLDAKLFLSSLQLGGVSAEEAEAKMKTVKLSDAEKKQAESLIMGMNLMTWYRQRAGNKVLECFKKGVQPPNDPQSRELYAALLLGGAGEANDAEGFAKAVELTKANLKARESSVPKDKLEQFRSQVGSYIDGLNKKLAEMRAASDEGKSEKKDSDKDK